MVSEGIVSDAGNGSKTTSAPNSMEDLLNLEDILDAHDLENKLLHIDEFEVKTVSIFFS